MDEIGERLTRDRFDRIAEQHVAGVAVAPLCAWGEIERLLVEGLNDLGTRGGHKGVLPGQHPLARDSRGVAHEAPQGDRRSTSVELRYVFLNGIVECQSPALGEAENRRRGELLRD